MSDAIGFCQNLNLHEFSLGYRILKHYSAQQGNSKAESMASFFQDVKAANVNYKTIVAVIDNFASHKSKIVKDKTAGLGIYLVYLPPYSPDLNPTEFIWKSIKRPLSVTSVKSLEDAKESSQKVGPDSPLT